MILGMILGFNLRDSLRNKRDIQTVIERNDRLEQLIDLINERYVDTVVVNNLYRDAVSGIISHLDPHTIYIPAEDLQSVNEDMDGHFYGIGVEFSILSDTILVTAVVPGGPAEKAGVRMGDAIIRVNDSLVAGTGITSERIIQLLRGKQYSRVTVSLLSLASGEEKDAEIERNEIPLYSVDVSILLDENTGYIRINRFSATTYTEFASALTSLKEEGAIQIIVDLRQNPGGYLDAATRIADDFLDGDKLITYTEGRQSSKKTYKSERRGLFEKGKLAILVDETSASASEILAGAIQDWDRGIVVGRRSYGKGLVQEQYELGDGSALRLTIAKYYTPSGRSIQRSYADGREAYQEDFTRRYEAGVLTGADTTYSGDTVRYYTSAKRVVYGGGGIMPDVHVPYDTADITHALWQFLADKELEKALWQYYFRNQDTLQGYGDITAMNESVKAAVLLRDVVASMPEKAGKRVRELLKHPLTQKHLALHLKARLARMLFRSKGYYTVLSSEDPVVRAALQSLEETRYSALIER